MHARVTSTQGPAEAGDDAQTVLREKILPQARQIAGFKGVLSLENREAGKALHITLWESEEAMQASEAAADTLRDQAVSAIEGSELKSVERYEVMIDER